MTEPSVKKSDAFDREAFRAFQEFYGKNLSADRLVLDVLEEDDARSFRPE
jgi:hypothetical protein